jgi:hypothetical protein
MSIVEDPVKSKPFFKAKAAATAGKAQVTVKANGKKAGKAW